jgi:hypothetical protein
MVSYLRDLASLSHKQPSAREGEEANVAIKTLCDSIPAAAKMLSVARAPSSSSARSVQNNFVSKFIGVGRDSNSRGPRVSLPELHGSRLEWKQAHGCVSRV